MSWPGVSDYQEAIQAPNLCFGDPDLKVGSPVLTKLGLPRPISGGNASVYQIRSGKNEWAVRCFLRDLPDMQKRYAAIDQHLRTSKLPKVGFQYLQEGIRIRGRWIPILKMEWVRGIPLNEHIQSMLQDPKALRRLADEWTKLMRFLRKDRVAHGDLQHGNVMVSKDKLVLIDYDGMYVPALDGNPSHELGHTAYQHPRRQPSDFGPGMDRFSALLVHTAILALSQKPDLWAKYDNADNLLFGRDDLIEPDQSTLFDELEEIQDKDVAAQARALRAACSAPIDQVPEIDAAVKVGKKLAKQRKQTAVTAEAPVAPQPATPPPAPQPVAQKPAAQQPAAPKPAGPKPPAQQPAGAAAPKPAAAPAPAAKKPAPIAASGKNTPSWVSAVIGSSPNTTSTPAGPFGMAQVWVHNSPASAASPATPPAQPAGNKLLAWMAWLPVIGAARRRRLQALVRPGGKPSAGTGRSPVLKAVAFSLDGRYLLAGGDDRFADVYDAQNGKRLGRLGPHKHAVTGTIPAGKDRFATCSLDGRVRVFTGTGSPVKSWSGSSKARFFAAASTFDGELLAFGSGRMVKVFTNDGNHKATLRGHSNEVLAVALTRSKQHVVSGSIDHSVRIWSIAAGRCEHVLAGLHDAVEAVAVSDDGQVVAGGSRDGKVCIWESKSSRMLHRIDTQQHGVHALAFLPGTRTLLAGGAGQAIHAIDTGSGSICGTMTGHKSSVLALAISTDGRAIASASADGSIIVWSPKAKPASTPKTPAPQLQMSRP